ncbi:hypothetical protein [Enterobacter kobei]
MNKAFIATLILSDFPLQFVIMQHQNVGRYYAIALNDATDALIGRATPV